MTGITEGIITALNHIFGNQEQWPEPLVFQVIPLTAEQQNLLGGRKREDRSFKVQYVPSESQNAGSACAEVGDVIMEYLELIQTETGLIRCTNKRYEIVEGVLDFYFSCNRIICPQENEKEKMEQAIVKGINIKE